MPLTTQGGPRVRQRLRVRRLRLRQLEVPLRAEDDRLRPRGRLLHDPGEYFERLLFKHLLENARKTLTKISPRIFFQ